MHEAEQCLRELPLAPTELEDVHASQLCGVIPGGDHMPAGRTVYPLGKSIRWLSHHGRESSGAPEQTAQSAFFS